MVTVRSAMDIWNSEDSEEFSLVFDLEEEPSMAKQSFRDECDINNIMKKYEKTGLLDHVNQYQGQYADLTGIVDYHTALNQVIAAEEAFMTLPAGIRSRFDNDPGNFLAFVDDPNNEEEMIKMGLKQVPVAVAGNSPPVQVESGATEEGR